MESAIGRTCLSIAGVHLSIEIVGKGEVATKVGEGVNIVEDLAIALYFRRVRCVSLCRLKHHFSLLDAFYYIVILKRLVASDREFVSEGHPSKEQR